MSEQILIRFCAPSFAGMKTGSLFSCRYSTKRTFGTELAKLNHMLKPKGMHAIPLRYGKQRVLLYVYRISALNADFRKEEIRELLAPLGYEITKPSRCIAKLMRRLRETDSFPHEIGLFLGYPAEDVEGFIKKGAEHSKYTGCWKVYGDVEKSKKLFEKYDRCTNVYLKANENGRPLEKLIVAG